MRICPIAQNFPLVGPYFQRIIFRPQWSLPTALIVWGLCMASLKFLAIEYMTPMSVRPMAKRLDGSGYHLIRR